MIEYSFKGSLQNGGLVKYYKWIDVHNTRFIEWVRTRVLRTQSFSNYLNAPNEAGIIHQNHSKQFTKWN